MAGTKRATPYYPLIHRSGFITHEGRSILRVMKIKEAECKKVTKVVNERVSDDIYGCDTCKAVIDFNEKGVEYLELTVHRHIGDYTTHQFCQWKCVLEFLPKIKTDFFVSFPFLHYDMKGKTSAKELIKLLASAL